MGAVISSRRRHLYIFTSALGAFLLIFQFSAMHLYAAGSDISVQVCNSPVAPVILSPSSGTTEQATAILSGTAPANSMVYALRNSVETGFVTAAPDGAYTISTPLEVGSNSLQTSTRECNASALSNSISLQYNPPSQPKSGPAPAAGVLKRPAAASTNTQGSQTSTTDQPPDSQIVNQPAPQTSVLEAPVISSPRNRSVSKASLIIVKGQARSSSTVKLFVNGKQTAQTISSDGSFTMSAVLKKGLNRIEVSMQYGTAELKSKPIFVTYEEDAGNNGWSHKIWLAIIIMVLGAIVLIFKKRLYRK